MLYKNNHSLFSLVPIFLMLMAWSFSSSAQSIIDSVLAVIAGNNISIRTTEQYWTARKVEFKTGLKPYNPIVSLDWMKGVPVEGGNQTDFIFVQPFDFPTAYFKKNQLSKELASQTEFQLTAHRQNILIEAKRTCLELVYHNKLQIFLEQRKTDVEKLANDFQQRLEKGEGNQLDVNKANLQLLEINKLFRENSATINLLNQQLTLLNGGEAIVFSDTVYPALPLLPLFETLQAEIETVNPVLKTLEQQQTIAQKQVEVSRSMTLPKMEAGYHYQGILGQTFHGVHFGATIPLWENKNKVKMQRSLQTLVGFELQEHQNKHYYEIKQQYEIFETKRTSYNEYAALLPSINSPALLDKALQVGHISTIEYFLEMHYYHQAFNQYLQTEMEFNLAVADLQKHKL